MRLYQPYHYKSKNPIWTDADSAIRKIQKGRRILIGSGCAEPQHLVKALIRNANYFRDNEVVHILTVGIAPYSDKKYAANFRHNAFFIGQNIRDSVKKGHSDYLPIFLSDIPALFTSKAVALDAVIVQLSPPDKHGYCTLGTSVDAAKAAVESASVIIS